MKSWPIAPIGEVASITGGGTPRRNKSEYYGGDIPWVTPKDMKSWEITGAQVNITKAGLDNSPAKMIPRDSVLVVVRSGVLKHSLPLAMNRVPVAINQDMKALLCDERVLDPRYCARFLQSRTPVILRWVRATTADNFEIEKLRNLEMPLPPLAEQRRIAEILDKADGLRAKRRAALARLDTLTQSIFLDMFGDPADDWREVALGEICFVKGGKRLPKGEEYSTRPTPFRYIRVTDLKAAGVAEESLLYLKPDVQAKISRYTVREGDVIISIAGSIGLVAPVSASLDGANLTENAAKLCPRRPDEYDAVFLSHLLKTDRIQDQIGSHIGQVTIGKLALFRIEQVQVSLPPLSLQKEYRNRAKVLAALHEIHGQSLNRFDSLFASLQHRAFSGEL